MTTIFLGVEDDLSESTARAVLRVVFGASVELRRLHGKRAGGFGQIQKNILKYMNLAAQYPVLLVTDLDTWACPPALIAEWFGGRGIPSSMSFRVAVREIEAWLLADTDGFADYVGVSRRAVPTDVDSLADPKSTLISLAKKGRREIRAEIVPGKRNHSPQGLGYNTVLSHFVEEKWSATVASNNSESLKRAISDLARLKSNYV